MLFLLFFLVSFPALLQYATRNATRNACRTAFAILSAEAHASSNTTFGEDGPFATGSSGDGLLQGCGYGDPTRLHKNTPPVPLYLYPAVGTCQEYGALTTTLLPIDPPDPFISTEGASFCQPLGRFGSTAWVPLMNTILFIGFLVRWRYIENREAAADDDGALTAADYTVFVKGLARGVFADAEGGHGEEGLEALLRKDLEQLGFDHRQIHHIEVARTCAKEMKLVRKLADLKILKQELATMRGIRLARGQRAETPWSARRAGEVERQIQHARDQLDYWCQQPNRTTGHAFVVFNFEIDRNRLAKLLHRTPWQLRRLRLASWIARHRRRRLLARVFDFFLCQLLGDAKNPLPSPSQRPR